MRLSFNMFKLSNSDLKSYSIPEHSLEPFAKSFSRLIGACGRLQAEVSKKLNVSPVTVSNYLHGYRKNPDENFILKVSALFDVKPSYFREYRIMKLNEKLYEYPELIDVFIDLSDDSRRVIREYKNVLNPLDSITLKEFEKVIE